MLSEYNQQGLIVGDDEDEETFKKRVNLFNDPHKILEEMKLPLKKEDYTFYFDHTHLKKKYDLNPSWIYLWCSNKELMPWEAASTWVVELKGNVHYPVLQFRKGMKERRTYLGYDYEEIFLHEMIHAVRSSLKSTRFEEVIAYRSSKKKLRRILGPIFKNPHESILYTISWTLTFLASMLYSVTEISFFIYLFYTSLVTSIGFTLFGAIRLYRVRRLFSRAMRAIRQMFGADKSEAVVLRLNDEEILQFANGEMSNERILELASTSLKWQQILESYST